MAGSSSQNGSPVEEDTAIISTKGIEAFGRKFTTTAGHLIGDPISNSRYQNAMSDLHKQLRRPNIQRSVFSFAKTSPTELVRSRLSTSEIQYRALTYLPDELLKNIPEDDNKYSLFQGFQATLPESITKAKRHQRKTSRAKHLGEDEKSDTTNAPPIGKLKKEKDNLNRQLEMMNIRKSMAKCEIRDIDNKIANLLSMRKILVERLSGFETEEALLDHDILDVQDRLEDAEKLMSDVQALALESKLDDEPSSSDNGVSDSTFMSESIYERLPPVKSAPNKAKRNKISQKKSMQFSQEQFEPGKMIREFRVHRDAITTMDFDAPFGTMVTAALDDTVRVWDMDSGCCIGLLEGHTASVRTLQVEDNIVATGSMDATIRLWDLKKSHYEPSDNRVNKKTDEDDNGNLEDTEVEPPTETLRDCPLFTLEAHVNEVTALHFRGDTLISGSADKTLRHWDLEKGRCVQTLDVMWAAAQSSASMGPIEGTWRQTSKAVDSSADFVGAVQVFDAALACGTSDGMVRLWDLRSGQVHRSLVGHTGPVTCLQFDDVHLVTGSLDRSVRIWDLRTGAIFDAYAYESPIRSMMFDHRRIVAAAGENVVKVYDKMDGRHWDCGAGVGAEKDNNSAAIVERVRIKDGYMIEGRQDGLVGIWTC
ncbi:Mitochondrial division protein 1 [Podosphaera aphanis]|nr:Mitochondrial division protein 1 [Podosphaera aphanis]